MFSENARLQSSLDEARSRAAKVDFSSLGDRAQDILRIAGEQAQEVTGRATQDAERTIAQAEAAADQLTGRTAAELGDVRSTHLAELAALRKQGEHDAGGLAARAVAEAEQLITSARLQAASVCAEADATARGIVQAAVLESQSLTAAAESQAANLVKQATDQRDRILGDLREAQEAANATITAMLAEATSLQRASGERLAAETDQAATLRALSLAEAERVKVEATHEAGQIIGRAQQQASVVDERARQEFAWRRRQMRHDQDLLDRRKVAMLSQLTSLSALAEESADNFPDVPDLTFEDVGEFASVPS